MNLASIAQQLDLRLSTLPGLNAHYIGAVKSVSVPCSVVLLPAPINYMQVFASGAVQVNDWEIMLLTPLADDKEGYQRILTYAGSGEGSVKYALETDGTPFTPYTGLDWVKVKSCTFEAIEWQDQSFQGATFLIDAYAS
jgi:hypothetical protein